MTSMILYLDVAQLFRVQLLHDQGRVLLRLLLQLRQPVGRCAELDELQQGSYCDQYRSSIAVVGNDPQKNTA
jgi:hypothetical protein